MKRAIPLIYLVFLFNLITASVFSESVHNDSEFFDGYTDTHPEYLNMSAFSDVPIMRYRNQDLPPPLRVSIDHIDFPVMNSKEGQVLVFFSQNPGWVNSTVTRLTSDFIESRPEWVGNRTRDALSSLLFITWAENACRSHWFLKKVYPYYISIMENGRESGSLHPVYICYWNCGLNSPVIKYSSEELSHDISHYIESIEFETNNLTTRQVYVYFKKDCGIAGLIPSIHIADYIMEKPEWTGDRSRLSVITEIYLHWLADNAKPLCSKDPGLDALYWEFVIGSNDNRPSAVYPVHLGYYYAGLNGTPIMDPLLQWL